MRISSTAGPKQQANQHILLLDVAERLRKHAEGRRAIHLHLSALQAHNRREHHLRIAANSFDALIKRRDGQSFRLPNGDIIVIVANATVAEIDDVVLRLRYLFSDDPLVHSEADGDEARFCSWYDLAHDHDAFLGLAQAIHRRQSARRAAGADDARADGPARDTEAVEPMDPERLSRLETALRGSDLSALLRRQPVCILVAGAPPKPVYNEIYVSIHDLRRRVMPQVNIASDRWLFQRLTRLLDRRLISVLPEMESEAGLTTGMNLNVSTLLSDEFLAFDKALRQRHSKPLILELQVIDVFADMGAYVFARDFARQRGYRICIDGLSHLTFPHLRRDELGVDMEKIYWHPTIVEDVDAGPGRRFREAVERAGPARVVLCRCDDQAAVDFGQAQGITLFQGHHIDQMVAQGTA